MTALVLSTVSFTNNVTGESKHEAWDGAICKQSLWQLCQHPKSSLQSYLWLGRVWINNIELKQLHKRLDKALSPTTLFVQLIWGHYYLSFYLRLWFPLFYPPLSNDNPIIKVHTRLFGQHNTNGNRWNTVFSFEILDAMGFFSNTKSPLNSLKCSWELAVTTEEIRSGLYVRHVLICLNSAYQPR